MRSCKLSVLVLLVNGCSSLGSHVRGGVYLRCLDWRANSNIVKRGALHVGLHLGRTCHSWVRSLSVVHNWLRRLHHGLLSLLEILRSHGHLGGLAHLVRRFLVDTSVSIFKLSATSESFFEAI